MASTYQQYVCNTSGNKDDSQTSAAIPYLVKQQLSDSQTAQWNSHASFHPNIQQRLATQYDNQSKAFNLLESERESVATSFNEVNFSGKPVTHNPKFHDRSSSSKTYTTVQSSVKSLPGSLSMASKFNFRQLITSPSQGQDAQNNLRNKALMIADKENNLDSSYIRTDEDDLGSQAYLLKVNNNNQNNSKKQVGYLNHHMNLFNNQVASKESFGLNASEIVPLPYQGNITGDESMMLTNLSVLGQYLKETEVQSQVEQQHKSFQLHETNINDQSRMTSNYENQIKDQPFNKDLSQFIVPKFEAESQQLVQETACKQISFSDQKTIHQPNKSSECFEEKPTQFRSAQQTQVIEVNQPRILNQISKYPYENNYSSGKDNYLYESCKKMLHVPPQESICEKIQTLREDISNLFPEQNQSQRESTRKVDSMSSSQRQQQRVNAQFQQLIKQTNPTEGLHELIQCTSTTTRQSFLQQNHSPINDSANDLISKTEDRIRRSRADRSASKSAQSRSYATAPSLTSQPTQQDELALLRQEVKSLADQLRQEKHQNFVPLLQQQCCKHSNQEEEIKTLKLEISRFEDRFRNEVGNIQEHYKAYCRELKAKKASHLDELQSKLDASEKKNFELEAQLKEVKLKLEFSESDARKNHVSESQSRKYEKKLEDLRIAYEKLLRNVRAEERDSYHKEMIKLIEANKELQRENERLRGELFEYREQEERTQRRIDEQAMRAASERKSSRKRSKGAQNSNHKQQRSSRKFESSPVSHRAKSSSKPKIQVFKTQRGSNYDIIKGEASIVTTAQTPKKYQQSSQNKNRPQSSRFKVHGLNQSKSKEKTRQAQQDRDFPPKQSNLKHSASATKGSARSCLTRQALQQQINSQQLNTDIPARTSRFNEAIFTDSDF